MAMCGPRTQTIMAKSWRIRHSPKRPSYRTIVAAEGTLLLTPFLIFYQRGCKMGQIERALSAIRVWKGYLETAMDFDSECPLFQKITAK